MTDKQCSTCKAVKPLTYFHKNKRQKDGLSNFCRDCAAYAARKSRFGLSKEQYDEMYERQDGCCAICGKRESESTRKLAVDHDHKTGEIFGLLCGWCNHRFVSNRREPEKYLKAYQYLSGGTGLFIKNVKRVKASRK